VASEQVSVTTEAPIEFEATTSAPPVVETTAVPTTVAVTVAPTTPPTAPPTTTVAPTTTTTVAPTTTTTSTTAAPKTAPSITVRQLPCIDTGQSTFTDVTVTVDVSENDGDTVTVRGTFSYFDGRVTEALTPVAGGSISGDSVLVNGDGTATFTLRLSNDNYDDTVEVAVNATDSEGTDYDWMTFLTEPCGITPTTTTTTTTLPNIAPAGTLTATCTSSSKGGVIEAVAKVTDSDGDDVTVRVSSLAGPLYNSGALERSIDGGSGTLMFTATRTAYTGTMALSASLDDGRDTTTLSTTVSCP